MNGRQNQFPTVEIARMHATQKARLNHDDYRIERLARKTVHKYPIDITDRQYVIMPGQARLLTADVQRGQVCIWAEVDPDAPTEARAVHIAGTGHALPDDIARFDYLATVFHGPLVWHVYIQHVSRDANA